MRRVPAEFVTRSGASTPPSPSTVGHQKLPAASSVPARACGGKGLSAKLTGGAAGKPGGPAHRNLPAATFSRSLAKSRTRSPGPSRSTRRVVALARRFRASVRRAGSDQLGGIAAELAQRGHLNERGRLFSAASLQSMLDCGRDGRMRPATSAIPGTWVAQGNKTPSGRCGRRWRSSPHSPSCPKNADTKKPALAARIAIESPGRSLFDTGVRFSATYRTAGGCRRRPLVTPSI